MWVVVIVWVPAWLKVVCIAHMQGWPEPHIYGSYTEFMAGKSPNIRPYTAHIYDYGHPYLYTVCAEFMAGKAPNIRPYTVHKYDSGQPYTCAYVGRTRGWYRGCCCCAGAGATYKLHANEVSHWPGWAQKCVDRINIIQHLTILPWNLKFAAHGVNCTLLESACLCCPIIIVFDKHCLYICSR